MRRHPIFSDDETIAAIGHGLLACTLPKPAWTHAAHFAAATWIIARRPDMVAARDMPCVIRRYNEATGVANTDTSGYHETITQASLHVTARVLSATHGTSLHHACNAILASSYGSADWLLTYWSRDLLFSVKARRQWVAPDLVALPHWQCSGFR